jgi:hypothetical protein
MKPHNFLPLDELQRSIEQEVNAKLKEGERVAILRFHRHDDPADAPIRHMLVFTVGGRPSFRHEQEEAFFDAGQIIKNFINRWRRESDMERWVERYGTEPPEDMEP